jgi:hypothetical protein
MVAVKRVPLKELDHAELREVIYLSSLEHPSIMRIYGAFVEQINLGFVMELAEGSLGSLSVYVLLILSR